MTAWLLLFLTVGCAYVTYDSFRWSRAVGRAPFSVIATLWKGGLTHLSVAEQAELKQRYSSNLFGVGQFCWLFLATTLFLAAATVRAFLR
jgi:hypothetical protein